ncbi:IcmK-like type IV secretion system protein [Trinickia terrae]|uniref:IcmK-like type IV secretion system protein n=1 Tax=Trinickia terrae TaxID=2571161 RepID=A0A4U1I9H7_9BURK|nr:DotH/IcmK family type IV secretion protein [Trinickia terrae]TKC90154.1 IcmK-like type IV secretion system protein [Trinickia terrae]
MRKHLSVLMVALAPVMVFAQSAGGGGVYAPAPVQPQPQIARPQGAQPQAASRAASRYAQAANQPANDGGGDGSLDDVTPPIPVTRSVVRRLVQDSDAKVIDPAEIESIRSTTSRARRAAVSPYPGNVMPTPIHRTVVYAPDTRKQPEAIRLWQGTVTALVFTDMAGNPWNIESIALNCQMFDDGRSCGNGQGASAQVAGGANGATPSSGPGAPTNVLNLQSLMQYGYGNVVVRLQSMASPIVLVLKTGLDKSNENDMQVDFHVQGRSPSARPEMMVMQTLPGFDAHMSDFLYGVPPGGARQMKVSGGLAEAWIYNDALYVRTRVSILSPAFTDHVGSAEGIEVYKYTSAVPTLLASVNGSPTTLVVTGN